MLNTVPDDHLFTIQSMYGQDGARKVYQAMHASVQRMADIVQAEGIDCDWEWLDAQLVVGCDVSPPRLR